MVENNCHENNPLEKHASQNDNIFMAVIFKQQCASEINFVWSSYT